MTPIKIVIAKTEAGLDAAAGDFKVIRTTVRQFTKCASFYDEHFEAMAGATGAINIGEAGWVALAKPRNP
jgi:hypothetical protein